MLTEDGVAPEKRPATRSGDVVVGAALVVMLLLLVVIGLHARLPFPRFSSHPQRFDAAVVGGLEVVVIALLVMLRMRTSQVARTRRTARARSGAPGAAATVPDRLREALSYVLGVGAAVLAVLVVLLLGDLHVSSQRSKGTTAPTRPLPPHTPPPHSSAASASTLHLPLFSALYVLLAAVLVALIVMLVLRERQLRDSRAVDAQPFFAEEDLGAWHDTLLGGRRALLEVDDARAAIIACYVAMASRLSREGTERSAADTPDEFLHRVAGVLTFSAQPARRLTDLFYEARFSSHPMGDDERAAARSALDELVTDLSSRRRDDAPDGNPLSVGSI